MWKELNLSKTINIPKYIHYTQYGLEIAFDWTGEGSMIDVLFFDIDGGEYQLLEGLRKYRPKFICVEYNNSYPLCIDFVPNSIRHGVQASSRAMYRLMAAKGYTYCKSFFHDHVFISNEFLDKIKPNVFEEPLGITAFANNASKHLYNYFNVLAFQKDPVDGINFCKERLDFLINNGSREQARIYFWFTTHTIYSFKNEINKARGEEYCKSLWIAYDEFHHSYALLLF